MSGGLVRSIPVMGTIVTIDIVDAESGAAAGWNPGDAIERAFEWFREVERLCSRFDERSELRRLIDQPGVPIAVSEILFSAVEFAIAVAEDTGGAFDPTVGREMESRGFNRNYATGEVQRTTAAGGPVSFRDVTLGQAGRTIALRRPLVLDLGAVAKGLAMDLAAHELSAFGHFAIDAGGDVFVRGRNAGGELWSIGIRHPRRDREIIEVVRVSDAAVCTSGDYERPGPGPAGGHHIIDARTGLSADGVVSATVVAPTSMLADALATAAFVLGPAEGIRLLERHQVEGVLLSPALERFATRGMHPAVLPDA